MPEPNINDDRSNYFSRLPGSRDTNRRRDINLIIGESQSAFEITAQTRGLDSFDIMTHWRDTIPLTKEELWGVADSVRRAWQASAVDFKCAGIYPLQQKWDFSKDPDVRSSLLPKLAKAGERLFRAIFFPPDIDNPNAYCRLNEIGENLRAETKKKSLWVRISSSKFYAPWNLIYSDELSVDGSDARPEGFWGYRHVVEQAPSAGNQENNLNFHEPLQVGLHLDENIDNEFKVPCNDVVLELLDSYVEGAIKSISRNRSEEFKQALRVAPLLDHVLYFCCHAVAEGDERGLRIGESRFTLTDRENPITPAEMDQCLQKNQFEKSPSSF